MIVLDTNVISELCRPRPDPGVVEWLGLCGDDAAITAVTVGELLAGVQRLTEGRRKLLLAGAIQTALAPYRRAGLVLSFDDVAAAEYATVVGLRERHGRPISVADAQIAAICRTHHATCATRNVKDFAHTGVHVVDPWSA